MQNKILQMKRAMRTALLVLLLSVVGVGKMEAQEFTVGNLNYSINGTTVTVTGHVNGTSASGTLDIPETVSYNGVIYTVTEIKNYAFKDCMGITGNLTIPNGVTRIGIEAFSGCIGFKGSLIIPNSITIIGESAFSNCIGFTGTLTIPNSITAINRASFYHCEGLTDLVIPNSVTQIGNDAFGACFGFTSITIPSSVTAIESNAFSSCEGVIQIIVDSENPVYDSRNNCNGIIETATNTLITGCMNTIIHNSVVSIDEDAFDGCKGLTSISIPSSVTAIEGNPFRFCTGLERISVETGNTVYDSRENCNAIIESGTNKLIVGCKNAHIPNSVISLGSRAFYGCLGLSSITIPNSVTSFGFLAFGFSKTDTVVALSSTPIEINHNIFYPRPVANRLIVCCGNKEAYENSSWANYFSVIEEDCNSHNIIIDENNMNGGNVSTSVSSAELGEEVQLTVTPDEGMYLASLIVCNVTNPEQTVPVYPIGKTNSMYGIIMPSYDVLVKAVFVVGNAVDESCNTVLSISPNPTNGQVKIEAENLKHITINNMLGQTIYDGNASGNEFTYDLGKHGSGLYLIRIETASGMAVKKVSVTR